MSDRLDTNGIAFTCLNAILKCNVISNMIYNFSVDELIQKYVLFYKTLR